MRYSVLCVLSISCLLSTIVALELPTYPGLKTSQKPGVLEVTFYNEKSTTNLWDQDTLSGLTDIVQKLQNDNETKVVVFNSDVPKYFLNHLDFQIEPFGTWMLERHLHCHSLRYQ
jgi:enoyl-CoA hydratase/carnithine racemase